MPTMKHLDVQRGCLALLGTALLLLSPAAWSASCQRSSVCYTSAAGLRLRDNPSPTGKALALVSVGTRVAVDDLQGNWAQVDLGNGQLGWLPKDALQPERPRFEELMRQFRAAADVAGRRKWAERVTELAPLDLDAQRALLSVLNEQGDTTAAARVQTMIDAVQKGTLPTPTDEPRLVMLVSRYDDWPEAIMNLMTGIPGSAENMPQGIATRVGKPYLLYTLEGKRVGYIQVDRSETHECGFSNTYANSKAITQWPAHVLFAMNTELPAQTPPAIRKPSSSEKTALLALVKQAVTKLTNKHWVAGNLKVADVRMLDDDGDGVEDAVGQYYAYSQGKKLSFSLLMFAKGRGDGTFSPEFTSVEEGREAGPDDVFDTQAREYHLRIALDFDGDGARELVFDTGWDDMTYKRKPDGKWVWIGESAAKACD